MKTRNLFSALIILLISVMTILPGITPTRAQSPGSVCVDESSNFPNSGIWTTVHGDIGDGSLWASTGTYQGITQNYAIAISSASFPYALTAVTYQLSYFGTSNDYVAAAVVELDDASSTMITNNIKYIGFPGSWNAGTWEDFTAIFSPGVKADHLQLIIYHNPIGQAGVVTYGIKVRTVCYDPSQPVNPTSTPPATDSPTPTNTFTPSNTPTPTITPTPNLTTTETLTLTPTDLTGTPFVMNGGVASTVKAPGSAGCDEDPANPCGKMPFSVAVYPTFDLPSPTYIYTETPTGTLTAAPSATYGEAAGTVVAIVTDVAVYGTQQSAFGTLTVNDQYGTPVSLPDAANEIGQNIGTIWSLARQIANFSLGKSGVIFGILLLVTALILLVRLIGIIIKILKALFKGWQQVIGSIIPK